LTSERQYGTLRSIFLYYLIETIAGKEDTLPVSQYKKVEKEYADRLGASLRRIWVSLGNAFRFVMVKGKQRFTVMLIPHSEKKIFNFQISFFTLIFATFTLGIVLLGFFLLATHFTYTNEQNVRLARDVESYGAQVASLKDEIAQIRAAGKQLKSSVDAIVTATAESQDNPAPSLISPVMANVPLTPEDTANGNSQLVADLRTVTAILQSSSDSLDQISSSINQFQDLFASTPTTWPLKGGGGFITTRFGWTTNPFTKIGYMHTGVDIAWAPGTPVVATADGKVVQTGHTDDLGNFILIQHKYGFYTRYAHLSGFAGKFAGVTVKRGDTIGYLGSTGLVTGPHLHYEVRLGAQYINPMPFLQIKPENTALALASYRGTD
jgi:murein DD-endopeptidase MepM/ murein hydrolase activator NlpD